MFDDQEQTVPESQHLASIPTLLSRDSTRAELSVTDEENTYNDREEDGEADYTRQATIATTSQNAGKVIRSGSTVSTTESDRGTAPEMVKDQNVIVEDINLGRAGPRTAAGIDSAPEVLANPSLPSKESESFRNLRYHDKSPQTAERGAQVDEDGANASSQDQRPDKIVPASLKLIPDRHTEPDVPSLTPFTNGKAGTQQGVVPNAFDRMRPRRRSPEVATVTIGSKVLSTVLGTSALSNRKRSSDTQDNLESISQRMRRYAAPGSTVADHMRDRKSLKSRGGPRNSYGENEDGEGNDPSCSFQNLVNSAPNGEEDSEAVSSAASEDNVNDSPSDRLSLISNDEKLDEDYIDEHERKERDQARVEELIAQAEQESDIRQVDLKRRAHQLLMGSGRRDQTHELLQNFKDPVLSLRRDHEDKGQYLKHGSSTDRQDSSLSELPQPPITEPHASLTISKEDFARMHIVGQFNLGFILATRNDTDLFIIDQHASDEKRNFEHLQETTTVQTQRLVHPKRLGLTAVDEEIILENNSLLLKNGFEVELDMEGNFPVGQRCTLVSLPMSKDVTFTTADLEELISLIADDGIGTSSSSYPPSSSHVPRPGKIRRMFAMRACRSSVMIGKTLTRRAMEGIVRRMGEIDKPWNCPHGRPTMRHVCGLGDGEGEWKGRCWREGDGLATDLQEEEKEGENGGGAAADWKAWVRGIREGDGEEEEEEAGSEDN